VGEGWGEGNASSATLSYVLSLLGRARIINRPEADRFFPRSGNEVIYETVND
jgi:hypothetical protein